MCRYAALANDGYRSLTAVEWPSAGSPTWPPVGRIRCPPTGNSTRCDVRPGQRPTRANRASVRLRRGRRSHCCWNYDHGCDHAGPVCVLQPEGQSARGSANTRSARAPREPDRSRRCGPDGPSPMRLVGDLLRRSERLGVLLRPLDAEEFCEDRILGFGGRSTSPAPRATQRSTIAGRTTLTR